MLHFIVKEMELLGLVLAAWTIQRSESAFAAQPLWDPSSLNALWRFWKVELWRFCSELYWNCYYVMFKLNPKVSFSETEAPLSRFLCVWKSCRPKSCGQTMWSYAFCPSLVNYEELWKVDCKEIIEQLKNMHFPPMPYNTVYFNYGQRLRSRFRKIIIHILFLLLRNVTFKLFRKMSERNKLWFWFAL